MKRMISFLLIVLSLFAFCSCNAPVVDEAKIELTYGEKYIYSADVGAVEGKQNYFVFYDNGTAEYHRYSNSSGGVYQYTVRYIYNEVTEENMIFCFFDSVEYGSKHTAGDIDSTRRDTLVCSENVVMTVAGECYILESYLEKIPNYGK